MNERNAVRIESSKLRAEKTKSGMGSLLCSSSVFEHKDRRASTGATPRWWLPTAPSVSLSQQLCALFLRPEFQLPSALTPCNQMWHAEDSDDSWEDKVAQSPTFNEACTTSFDRPALGVKRHLPNADAPSAHTHQHISLHAPSPCGADGTFSHFCAIPEAITY